jgi:hypothetical protein
MVVSGLHSNHERRRTCNYQYIHRKLKDTAWKVSLLSCWAYGLPKTLMGFRRKMARAPSVTASAVARDFWTVFTSEQLLDVW